MLIFVPYHCAVSQRADDRSYFFLVVFSRVNRCAIKIEKSFELLDINFDRSFGKWTFEFDFSSTWIRLKEKFIKLEEGSPERELTNVYFDF